MILSTFAAAVSAVGAPAVGAPAGHIRFSDLGLDPDIFTLGFFTLRWYSLAYIAGIVIGWWYLLKLLKQPGAPMARRHADDLVFYATLGIILGGRLGYVLFYAPEMVARPFEILKLWDGGMSFHGGVIGTSLGIILFARKHGLNWLRIHDFVACCVPFGLFFGRLANFVNGELWGRPSDAAWAIVFNRTVADGMIEPARHPSQLYEAGLEGIVLFALLWWAFWRTDARYQPGRLVGLFLVGYGVARYTVEFFREPDRQYATSAILGTPGLHMGQLLCLPMVLAGAWLMWTAPGRRQRVESTWGTQSVA